MIEPKFAILFFIVLSANAVEAVTGFGSTIIAITLGAHMYDMKHLLYVLVPLNLVLSTYIVVRHRKKIDRTVLLRNILPQVAVGVVVGRIIFSYVNGGPLKFIFGVFVLLFSVYEITILLRRKGKGEERPLGNIQGMFWLFSGGIMQGIYASGGPMVVYFASRRLKDKSVFRSTLSSLWLTVNIFLTASYAVQGSVNRATILESLELLPGLLLGLAAGEWLHSRIPEFQFRLFVFILLLVAGASLVIKI